MEDIQRPKSQSSPIRRKLMEKHSKKMKILKISEGELKRNLIIKNKQLIAEDKNSSDSSIST